MDKIKESFLFSSAAPIAILGVPFDNLSISETIDIIKQMVRSGRPHYLATANVDFLVQASEDAELRRILFDAHLVLCDGTPLVWASRLLGNPLPERVAGSDLVPLLLQVAEEEGFRPFFLGSTPDAIQQAVKNVMRAHPRIQIAGSYSPPFNKLLEMDHEEICRQIRQTRPDLLFVGFGCPKQEKWINMHYRSLGVPVSVGVGATIDFLAGKVARAPRWMQKSGTEWVFRLLQEPRRLMGRYSRDLVHFSKGIVHQYWHLRARHRAAHPPVQAKTVQGQQPYLLLEMPPRLDFETVHTQRETMEAAVTPATPCVVDLQRVEFVDSTGVGLLVRLQKRARVFGQPLILLAPSVNVQRALSLMKLTDFFTVARDLESAAKILHEFEAPNWVRISGGNGFPEAILWQGELTAANADEFWHSTVDHLNSRQSEHQTLTIDLGGLGFIDSTGLSVMIRTKKYGARHGLRVEFEGARGNVLNVIRISRLEEYLLAQTE